MPTRTAWHCRACPLYWAGTTPVEAVPAIWTWQSGPKSMACLVGRGDAQGQVPRS